MYSDGSLGNDPHFSIQVTANYEWMDEPCFVVDVAPEAHIYASSSSLF
jgi:hypothetical protein